MKTLLWSSGREAAKIDGIVGTTTWRNGTEARASNSPISQGSSDNPVRIELGALHMVKFPFCFAQVLVSGRTTTPRVEHIIMHRIGDHSGGGCHLGVYLDVLRTRVVGRLEDNFQRRWLEWGHGG